MKPENRLDITFFWNGGTSNMIDVNGDLNTMYERISGSMNNKRDRTFVLEGNNNKTIINLDNVNCVEISLHKDDEDDDET